MSVENNHITSLFEYIFFAPKEIQKKYNNGFELHSEQWFANNTTECSFNGLIFKDNKVFVYNIYLFDANNDYAPEYLEITDFFNEALRDFSIYHLSLIIPKAIRKLYSDSKLTENIIPQIRYDKPYRLPKLRHNITKHNSKERKFIKSSKSGSIRLWNEIIYNSIHKISNLQDFKRARTERPNSLFYGFGREPELRSNKNNSKLLSSVQSEGWRIPRRRFGAFGSSTWRNTWEHKND